MLSLAAAPSRQGRHQTRDRITAESGERETDKAQSRNIKTQSPVNAVLSSAALFYDYFIERCANEKNEPNKLQHILLNRIDEKCFIQCKY